MTSPEFSARTRAINSIATIASSYDFSEMHAAIQKYVDDNLLAGASALVLKNNQPIDFKCWGYADIEAQQPIAADTIFRIYSNTKIITAVAAMMLYEEGRFQLDDPIEQYLPALANRQVLKPESTDLGDTEPARQKPTVRQVMCHNAGFSYGFLMESPVDTRYNELNMMAADSTLEQMIEKLRDLPLAYQPGARWQYSVSSDILARLVEIWSGKSFIEFLKERLFEPLGMADTDFYVPASKHDRFAVNYAPEDPMQPMKPGLHLAEDVLLGGYLEPKRFMSGGGGLVSTLPDYAAFIQMLVAEGEFSGERILKPETIRLMRTNHLPEGVDVQLPRWVMPDTVFGLGLAIKTAARPGEPDEAIDEFHWGGMAGTHTWISPRANLAALIFTQRMPGFWHPFSHEFKRQVYAAASR